LAAIFPFLERTVPCRSSEPANRQSLYASEPLPFVPLPDWSTTNEIRPRASDSIRASGGAAGAIPASLNGDRLAKGVRRDPAKAILAAIFQDQLNSRTQAFATLFHAMPLAICARNLRRPGDKPIAVALNNRCEFVPHGRSIERKPDCSWAEFRSPKIPLGK